MKSGIFVLMATMVATSVHAAGVGKMLPGVCAKLAGDAKDACLKQVGYTIETTSVLEARLGDAEKRLHDVECREADAAEALKACGAGKTLAQRLKQCVDKMVNVRRAKNATTEVKKAVAELRAKVAEHDQKLADHTRQIKRVEAAVVAHDDMLEEHTAQIETIGGEIDDLQENGPSVALLAGVAVARGGGPFNLGFGLSQPVAEGAARVDTEVLIGLQPEHLALTLRERVRQSGDGLVLGGNIAFLAQGRTDLSAAREVFLGVGPSLGWSGERVSVYLDLAAGPDRVAKRGWGVGGSAGLTLAVQF